ncbi:hypothetical protein RRG08_032063 [Elysia crispata]|uniref:Uncharacterized protein n=1 Tax=Elysia crispata TaxID=231223 RepID=A0AAE0ZGV7_9GAST|nr:hypothetical protein RRG08_032063 [Elysia crispata]
MARVGMLKASFDNDLTEWMLVGLREKITSGFYFVSKVKPGLNPAADPKCCDATVVADGPVVELKLDLVPAVLLCKETIATVC